MKKLPVLPPMPCEAGCGECCGPAPVTAPELARVRAFVRDRDVKPAKASLSCPWFQNGGCSVYDVRPLVCRIYGHTPALPCSRGHNRNVARRVVQAAVKANGIPVATLHDLAEELAPGQGYAAAVPPQLRVWRRP